MAQVAGGKGGRGGEGKAAGGGDRVRREAAGCWAASAVRVQGQARKGWARLAAESSAPDARRWQRTGRSLSTPRPTDSTHARTHARYGRPVYAQASASSRPVARGQQRMEEGLGGDVSDYRFPCGQSPPRPCASDIPPPTRRLLGESPSRRRFMDSGLRSASDARAAWICVSGSILSLPAITSRRASVHRSPAPPTCPLLLPSTHATCPVAVAAMCSVQPEGLRPAKANKCQPTAGSPASVTIA